MSTTNNNSTNNDNICLTITQIAMKEVWEIIPRDYQCHAIPHILKMTANVYFSVCTFYDSMNSSAFEMNNPPVFVRKYLNLCSLSKNI